MPRLAEAANANASWQYWKHFFAATTQWPSIRYGIALDAAPPVRADPAGARLLKVRHPPKAISA